MKYKTVQEAAQQWAVSERIVRRYCTEKRIPGVVQINKAWRIPVNAVKPGTEQVVARTPKLLKKLISQRNRHGYRGLYDYVQINMAYSNSRMASNRLSRNLVEHLYATDRVANGFEDVKVNDIIEARNHFVVMDMLLDEAMLPVQSNLILNWQRQLLSESCRHKRKSAVTPGFRTANCVLQGKPTTAPKEIIDTLNGLCAEYEQQLEVGLQEILELHVRFEQIRPFEDGNGRIGRLLMFKECLRHGVMPFILDDKHRTDYLNGIRCWAATHAILCNVCREAQDRFKAQVELQKLLEKGMDIKR
ncbi:MAG: Fic family protein [Clostridia bacterium]|nr:Fic family protein [Clostridia bacterium]